MEIDEKAEREAFALYWCPPDYDEAPGFHIHKQFALDAWLAARRQPVRVKREALAMALRNCGRRPYYGDELDDIVSALRALGIEVVPDEPTQGSRIDTIGQNGNDGLHYVESTPFSNFIRNATPEEKKRVYEEVINAACAEQAGKFDKYALDTQMEMVQASTELALASVRDAGPTPLRGRITRRRECEKRCGEYWCDTGCILK